MTSSYAFSQNATTTIEYINIPVPTVKKITIDLLRGDSALAQLDLSNRMIAELQSKTVLQDNIISNYEKKEQNYLGVVTELEKKVSVYQTELKNTQQNNWLRFRDFLIRQRCDTSRNLPFTRK
jgi:hypothetical protein